MYVENRRERGEMKRMVGKECACVKKEKGGGERMCVCKCEIRGKECVYENGKLREKSARA